MTNSQKSTVRDLRRNNRQRILEQIYFNKSISRQEISQLSELSVATVTNIVVELIAEGIVIEAGVEESQGGRPRAILMVNSTYGYLIGMDLGETHIRTELFDLTMTHMQTIYKELGTAKGNLLLIVDWMVECVEEIIAKANIEETKVLGVGIGVPGLVEQTKNGLISIPTWGWDNVPMLKMLKERLNIPLYIDNGAKTMSQAEMWFGAGRSEENLAVLLIGTGVGAGLISQGSLYRGTTNSAGEWGHTVIKLDGRDCRCGSTGCLETYVGAPGIIQSLREIAPDSAMLIPENQVATIKALIAAAGEGNPLAQQVIKETSHYLGAGIANLINLFNPELIVLGGWVGIQLGDYITPELYPIVERYALKQPFTKAKITVSTLGQDGISVGAACLPLLAFLSAPVRMSFVRRA